MLNWKQWIVASMLLCYTYKYKGWLGNKELKHCLNWAARTLTK